MARRTRDSFNDANNYKGGVVFQIGTPAVDNELNELQSIVSTDVAETALASMTVQRHTLTGMARAGFAASNEWEPYAVTTPSIFIRKGTLFVDGFRISLATDLDLTSAGLTFPVVGGADVYGWLYVDFVFTEIDSTMDPNIATAGIGETTRRIQVKGTWGKGESTLGFPNAFTAITALPSVTDARLWKGNTARVFIARYRRTAGSTNITTSMLQDMRHATPAELLNTHKPAIKFHRAIEALATEGNGHSDGVVLWDATTGILQIGTRDVTTDADELLGAASLVQPGGPRHRIAAGSNQEWLENGAANANGTMLTPDLTGTYGFTIPDGSALGYYGVGSGTAFLQLSRRTKGSVDIVSVQPQPATANPLVVEGLNVQTVATFAAIAGPGTFVLCTRVGNDLVWWNGNVTRGNLTQPVVSDPTGADTHVTVVGKRGSTHGSAKWAVETLLNFMTSGKGTGAFGLGRVAKFYVQRGDWRFAQGIHTYGTPSEYATNQDTVYDADNTYFELDGDGPGLSKITLNAATTSGRASGSIAEMVVSAQRIVIKNVTITQNYLATVRQPGYLLDLTASEVILENCHFIGSVRIASNNVKIRDCYFIGLNTSGAASEHFSSTQGNLTAQHLLLASPPFVDPSRWEISNCWFRTYADEGTHAGTILFPADETKVHITNNTFEYASLSEVPSIDVHNEKGNIIVEDNNFIGARGVSKDGFLNAVIGNWDGDYSGCPLMDWGASRFTAAGYISLTTSRSATSHLTVRNNRFSMLDIGTGFPGTFRWIFWSAFEACLNSLSTGETDPVLNNITFESNHCDMYLRSTAGQWLSTNDSKDQPILCGFGLHLTVEDNDLAVTNSVTVNQLRVVNNRFVLGTTATGSTRIFRSVLAPLGFGSGGWAYNLKGWPTTRSGPIVVQLNNADSVAFNGKLYRKRLCYSPLIEGNTIMDSLTGGALPGVPPVTLKAISWAAPTSFSDANHPAHVFTGIAMASSARDALPDGFDAGSAGIIAARISSNTVMATSIGTVAGSLSEGVFHDGSYGNIVGNTVLMSALTAPNNESICFRQMGGTQNCYVANKRTTGDIALHIFDTAVTTTKVGANAGFAGRFTVLGGFDDTFDTNANFS